MSKLHVPEAVRAAAASASASSGGGGKGGGGGGGDGGAAGPAAAGVMLELLEGTLWQRQLGALSEEMVAALVCQVGSAGLAGPRGGRAGGGGDGGRVRLVSKPPSTDLTLPSNGNKTTRPSSKGV